MVKKVDLLGSSKWEVIFDRKVEAKISDLNFLYKIKNGETTIAGCCYLDCELKITKELDENYETFKQEYVILKIHGIKYKEPQLDLFKNKNKN